MRSSLVAYDFRSSIRYIYRMDNYAEKDGPGKNFKMFCTNLEAEGVCLPQTGDRVNEAEVNEVEVNEAEDVANVAAFAECIRIIFHLGTIPMNQIGSQFSGAVYQGATVDFRPIKRDSKPLSLFSHALLFYYPW